MLLMWLLFNTGCTGLTGWQDVVPADQAAHVWSWRQAVVVPTRVLVAGEQTLWMIGQGGVLRSPDHGTTWQVVRRGLGDFNGPVASQDGMRLCALEYEPGKRAVVCTDDGAQSWWQTGAELPIDLVATEDGRDLWLLSQVSTTSPTFAISHSRDGGRNWSEEWRGPFYGQLYVSANGSLAVLMADNGLILRRDQSSGRWSLDQQLVLGQGANVKSVLTGSPDGDALWVVVERPNAPAAVVRLTDRATRAEWCSTAVPLASETSSRIWFQAGLKGRPAFLRFWSQIKRDKVLPVALRSSDGCFWTEWQGAARSSHDVIAGFRDHEFWALVETEGAANLLHSIDDGKGWQQIWTAPRTDASLKSMAAFDDGRLMGLSGNVVIEGSISSGWQQSHLDVPGTLSALASTRDRRIAWAVGDGGVVARSQAPGRWDVRRVPVETCPMPCRLNDVFGADDGEHVWIVGDGVLLHSADGGITFAASRASPGFRWRAVHGSHEGRTVVAVAEEGFAARSTGSGFDAPAGLSDRSADAGLSDVFVAGDGRGVWAVRESGGRGPVLYHSTDGGRTWQPPTVPLPLASDNAPPTTIAGTRDGGQLWIVNRGGLFASADGGQTWHTHRVLSRQADLDESYKSPETSYSERVEPRSIAVSPDGRTVVSSASTPSSPTPLVVEGRPVRDRVRISEARFVADNTRLPRLEVRLAPAGIATRVTMDVFGGNAQAKAANRLIPLKDLTLVPPASGDARWALPIDPADRLGVPPGQEIHFRIEVLEPDGVRQAFTLPAFVYRPWYEPYRAPSLIIGGVLAALAGAGGLLLLVAPFSLIRLADPVQRVITAAPLPVLGDLLKLFAHMLIVPAFAQHRRVLDAWIRRHESDARRAFGAVPAVATSETFVALPLKLGDPDKGELIERPAPDLVGRCLAGRQAIVQIVGPGGAGKTTLALQLARWAMDGAGSTGLAHGMMPVFVDEDTTDLARVVRRKLRAMVDVGVPDWLCEALVRKNRLLVIVDRLSERDEETQRHVANVHGTSAVGTLLITSRRPIAFEAGAATTLHPQPLGSATLLHFMTSLLTARGSSHLFGEVEQQIDLGHRLAALIPSGSRGTVSMTPLLVKLFVDRALVLAREGRPLAELPASIPDAYFEYLRAVNPAGPNVANAIPHDEMLRVAGTLAAVSLRVDADDTTFVPREFVRSRAVADATAHGESLDGSAMRRLVENGVLRERTSGPEPIYRFELDPVAEYLAAYTVASRCGGSLTHWTALFDRVASTASAAGFALALRLTCEAYGTARGWAFPPNRMTGGDDVSQNQSFVSH